MSTRPPLRALPPPAAHSSTLSEQSSLRQVMSLFATGVTVLTAGGEDGHAMTANSFTSVSLDPPMVLCCVSRAARMYEAIAATESFAVTILSAEQRELSRYFADWRRPRGMAQFDTVDWRPGPKTGAPLIEGALGWLECRLAHTYAGGDHAIFVGDVLSSVRGSASRALTFYGGGYHELDAPRRASA